MLSLFKSERFKTELAKYNQVLEQLENPQIKKELETLVRQLIGEVQQIDIGHTAIMQKNEISSNLGEARSRLTEIRKRIDKIVNDYNKISK